jgi:hypothetical protein
VQYDDAYDPLRPYFDANFLLLTVTSHLGLLLTFGFVFPPLAFVLLLAMNSTVYLSRLQVGRFLSDAVADDLHGYVERIEKECLGISWMLLRCVRVLVAVMAGFYALFAFDALGDTHGAKVAFAIVVVVFAIPLLLWGGVFLRDRYLANWVSMRSQTGELSVSIELPVSPGEKKRKGFVNKLDTAGTERDGGSGTVEPKDDPTGSVFSTLHA